MPFLFSEDDERRPLPTKGKMIRGGKLTSRSSYTRGSSGTRVFGSRVTAILSHTKRGKDGAAALARKLSYLARESATGHVGGVAAVGNVKLETFAQFAKREKRVFQLIVSPEEYFSLDPKLFVEALMYRLQERAGKERRGQQFEWAGVVHTNTANPHAHILFRGIDKDGKDVYIAPEVVAQIRTMAKEIQDVMTGALPITDAVRKERRAAGKIGWMVSGVPSETSLDMVIDALPSESAYDRVLLSVPEVRRKALHARLITLEQCGLLRLDEGRIQKTSNFADGFRSLQRLFDTVSKSGVVRYAKADEMIYAGSGYPGKPIGMVTGIVSTSNHGDVAMFETFDHKALVVPVSAEQRRTVDAMVESRILAVLDHGVFFGITEDPRPRFKKLGRLARPVGVVAETIASFVERRGQVPAGLEGSLAPIPRADVREILDDSHSRDQMDAGVDPGPPGRGGTNRGT